MASFVWSAGGAFVSFCTNSPDACPFGWNNLVEQMRPFQKFGFLLALKKKSLKKKTAFLVLNIADTVTFIEMSTWSCVQQIIKLLSVNSKR